MYNVIAKMKKSGVKKIYILVCKNISNYKFIFTGLIL